MFLQKSDAGVSFKLNIVFDLEEVPILVFCPLSAHHLQGAVLPL
jgi:hypothetical protein